MKTCEKIIGNAARRGAKDTVMVSWAFFSFCCKGEGFMTGLIFAADIATTFICDLCSCGSKLPSNETLLEGGVVGGVPFRA